jgi:hypothetical protein
MLLPDQDAELVSRLWKFDHDLTLAGQELAKSARNYEDRKWALRFVVDDMAKRMPEMAAAMQPNIQRKMNDAQRQLRDAAEKIVARELAEYRSAFDDEDEDGVDPEEG